MFRFKSLRYITIGSCLTFFVSQNIYFAINFSLESFGFDLYFNTIFVEVGEMMGYFLYFLCF